MSGVDIPDPKPGAESGGLTCMLVLLEPLTWAWWAWMLTTLWGWYGVPWLGEPSIAVALAVYVAWRLVDVGVLLQFRESKKDTPAEMFGRWIAGRWVVPAILLYWAWGAGKILGVLP